MHGFTLLIYFFNFNFNNINITTTSRIFESQKLYVKYMEKIFDNNIIHYFISFNYEFINNNLTIFKQNL